MALQTFDRYRADAESERAGLLGLAGRVMTFAGFIILANAFLVALLFRLFLSFRNQILCASVGAVTGVIGFLLREKTRPQIITAVIASTAAIAATVLVQLIEERFGLLLLAAAVCLLVWLIQKFEERLWKKL